jgi:hypothetical protein
LFEGTELGHFDKQGEGGNGREAGNAGQDCEPSGKTRSVLEDLRLDRRDVALDLFETLRIVAFQQGRVICSRHDACALDVQACSAKRVTEHRQ